MQCAYVEWIDSVHMADWNEASNLATAKPEVTCGILVENVESHVTVALSYAPETAQYGQVVSIPKVSIRELQIFNKPTTKRKTRAVLPASEE